MSAPRTRAGKRAARCLAVVAAAALSLAAPVGAQDSCQRQGTGSCTAGNSAAVALNITITRAIRMSLASGTVQLDAPTGLEFDAGFGQTAAPVLQVKSNTPWTLSLRTTQTLWTASPAPARANKPSTELEWGVAVAGPFTPVSTTATTIFTGTATAGTIIPLQFRVRYAWLLDTPGAYSLPLQLTLAAP